MLTLTCSRAGTSTDYVKYLAAGITKTDSKDNSELLDFSLYSTSDPAFVKLTRGDYITVNSTKYPKWFTGVIINDPELEYLGSKAGQPVWGYKYQATADDYILNVKPVGQTLVYLNRFAGEIIKDLVNKLNPDVFDVTGIANGPLLSQVTIDPDKKFREIVKELSAGTSYVFGANDKKLTFKKQDDATLKVTINKNDASFTPSRLSLKPTSSSNGIVNDVIVVSDIEPQNYVKEYFIGTGFDASFNLIDGVYGADTNVYLDEVFSGRTISSQWQVFDNPSTPYFVTNEGYLNCLGGDGGLSVYIRSTDPIPLEGHVRLTHGEWDFLSGVGIVAGLWKAQPSSGIGGCVYGLNVNGTTLNPIEGGVLDSSQSLTLSASKRYVIRTLMGIEGLNRSAQSFSYLNQQGVVETKTSSTEPAYATFSTRIVEIDPATGVTGTITDFWNAVSLLDTEVSAYYVPVASNNISCTVTGITISVPINASLSFADLVPILNPSFDKWDDVDSPTDWKNYANCEQVSSTVGFANKMNFAGGVGAQCYQVLAEHLKPSTEYTFSMRVKKGTVSSGTLSALIEYSTDGLDFFTIPILSIPATTLPSANYLVYSGTFVTPSEIYPGMSLALYFSGSTNGSSVYIDDVIIISDYSSQLIGPNEVDAIDGLAPAATIIAATPTAENFNSYLGVPVFNRGQSELVFFKDSINRITTIPIKDQVVRLSYRGAGPSIGRAVNRQSIYEESLRWGDTGTRSMVVSEPFPRPRNSEECEAYASAVVAEDSFDRYEGSYDQFSDYFSQHPKSGGVLELLNFPDFPDRAEEITSVSTICDSFKSEKFIHKITFGKSQIIKQLLDKFTIGTKKRKTSGSVPKLNPIDFNIVGTAYASDIKNAQIVGWDSEYIYVDVGENITADDLWFEVRSTDYGWGSTDSRNLLHRTTSRLFSIPRTVRGRAVFIRKIRKGNFLFYSEDQSNAIYTKTGCTVTSPLARDSDGSTGPVSTVVFSSAGSSITQQQLAIGATDVCFTCDIKGPVGKTITLRVGNGGTFTNRIVTMTGQWQRLSSTVTLTGGVISPLCSLVASEPYSVQTTKWSMEVFTKVERLYTRTVGAQYGPTSRYTAVLNVVFPIGESQTVITELGPIRPSYGG